MYDDIEEVDVEGKTMTLSTGSTLFVGSDEEFIYVQYDGIDGRSETMKFEPEFACALAVMLMGEFGVQE